MKIYVHCDENGLIQTWGEDPMVGTGFDKPADWHLYGAMKYKCDSAGTSLVVRDGWVDPVAEPEVPVEPEA